MEIKDLEARIEKKKSDIEKTKRTIGRLVKKNNFSEEDLEYVRTNSWADIANYAEANWQDYYKITDFKDLRGKYRTLDEQKVQLQKYENQLTFLKAKEEKEANTEKIPVIVNYLNKVKNQWVNKIEHDIKVFEDVVLAKYDEYLKSTWDYCYDHKLKYDRNLEYKLIKEYNDLYKKYSKSLDTVVLKYYNKRDRTFNWDDCNKELNKDIESLYWDLVNRITEKVGEIIDATNLSIGNKGKLNGLVKGTEGSVSVETIPAGGYNIQRFHFRTFVKPIK